MVTSILNLPLYNLLKSVDTPTVCNAIEVAQGKRGFNAFTKRTLLMSNPTLPAMVGFARTAIIKAREPSQDTPEVIQQKRLDYYRYMSEGQRPAIAVIEDADGTENAINAIGAYWGEINSTIHQAFGFEGALTNGVMRDLDDIPDNFPVIAGSIGPSHGFVHVQAINVSVDIVGLNVCPGDLIHADKHGAVVIPPDVYETLATAIGKLLASEALILEPARKPNFGFEDFQEAWQAFEKSRT